MAIDRARTAKGALAGAVAAGVWAAQQPLDKRLFASDYDDVELLGKAVAHGSGWYPAGLALHVQNGAVFGAAYATLAPLVPLPGVVRGMLAALIEHTASWPLATLSDRFHPARDEMPKLAGNRPALWQATWRHLLFGAVLGAVEQRLNPPRDQALLDFEEVASRNGHGKLERAVPVGSVSGPET
jgi:hypothetical protein